MNSTKSTKQTQANTIPAKRGLPLRIDVLFIVVTLVLGTFTNSLYSQPLKLGQSVVTSYDGANDNYNAVKVLDYRNKPTNSIGGNYWNANEYIGPNWNHGRMGNVFGIAIDDAVPPNIYVARSTVYSQTSRLNYPVLIYKIDGATWNVIDYVSKSNSAGPPVIEANTIPNTNPGLGNICYDKWHKQLFVTNHEDGMIYQIKDDGTGLLGIVKDVFDPFDDDVPSNGFVQRGERIWGIGVYGRSSADVRVYFGRWKSDYGYQSNGANEIWSVALDYSGNFIKTSERLEISLPLYSNNYSNPPSDIEFSSSGDMAISEKSMLGELDWAHSSRNLIFPRNINNKYDNANYVRHNIGINGQMNNSCGGADFEYGRIDSTTNSYQDCDSVVVGTGDYLYNRPGYGIVYGVQLTERKFGGSNNYMNYSHYTDLNGIYGTQDKMTPGDIDVYRKNSCSCDLTDSLYIKDSPNDAGLEPNYLTGTVMWDSKDIWVCNFNSNCTSHSNPTYNPPFKSYVNVRVRNANGSPSCGGVLTLQWAKASTGLAWPKPWDASVTYGNNNLQMGGLIGSKNIPAIGPYSNAVVSFEWTPPNPDIYFNDFQGDKGHFCLLARIETSEDAPYGMTYPETNDLYSNVKNNKKIAWKNVEVVNGLMPVYKPVWFYVGNLKPTGATKKFEFNVANGNSFFANATVTTKLSASLYQKWAAGGKQGSNVIELADSSIKILGNGAYITNLFLDSNSIHEMNINFLRDSKPDTSLLPVYEVDVVQYDVNQNRIEGGNRFSISTAVPVPVSIKVAIEGLYYGNSSDTVKAFLRSNTPPYSIVDSARSVVDPSNNLGQFLFANAPSGNYYIQIKHRNSIETWSRPGGVAYTLGSTLNYDFTSSASQAFGDNLIQVDTSPVVFAIYSGDVNQDGVVDASDVSGIDNDASNFESGYIVTDLNGDGFVDGSDFAIADNNASNFVSMITP